MNCRKPDAMPPHNIEVEERLLACMLADNDAIDEIAGVLTADDLFRDSHQTLFREMLEMHSRGERFDSITLGDRLEGRGQLERIGGYPAISRLLEGIMFHRVEAEWYARIVAAHALRRRLIEISGRAIDTSYAQDQTAEEVAAGLESAISDALTRHARPSEVLVGDVVQEVYENIIRSRDGEVIGSRTTGINQLDMRITGLEDGRLTIIAGRPGMGKSALALNVVEYFARQHDLPVYVFSLEMVATELTKRLISSMARVTGDKLKGRRLMDDAELRRVREAKERLAKMPIRIDDTSAKSISAIRSQARLARRKHGVGLVVVDHIGLVNPDPGANSRGETRQQHIGKISRMLKNLSRDLKIPVVGLSQLNRNNTERPDKRPTLSDLRESGDIEQDADTVLLIHRPDYYDREDRPGQAEIIIAKQRDGDTGIATVKFLREFTKFEDLEDELPPGVTNSPW